MGAGFDLHSCFSSSTHPGYGAPRPSTLEGGDGACFHQELTLTRPMHILDRLFLSPDFGWPARFISVLVGSVEQCLKCSRCSINLNWFVRTWESAYPPHVGISAVCVQLSSAGASAVWFPSFMRCDCPAWKSTYCQRPGPRSTLSRLFLVQILVLSAKVLISSVPKEPLGIQPVTARISQEVQQRLEDPKWPCALWDVQTG